MTRDNFPEALQLVSIREDLTVTYASIRPGREWLDTSGSPIQAHGGSIIEVDGVFYWYGENKEKTAPGNGIWHWGVRCYSSTDLYNWDDRGLIIPPDETDPTSPLHPSQLADRPHIIYNPVTRKFVCWIKVMHFEDESQTSTVLTADNILGPYTLVATDLKPLGMNAGDFDLVVEPSDGKAYYFFERVHSELICADLTPDATDVTGYYSTHFPHPHPPFVREAPAHFTRGGLHYLITSGTTGYFPNESEVAVSPTYHGPWTVLGDPHPTDPTRTSFGTQLSSIFKHPFKRDLYIALGDRWAVDFPPSRAAYVRDAFDRRFSDPDIAPGTPIDFPDDIIEPDTSRASYVWLPIRFVGEMAFIDWHEEWSIDDYA
jgi:hypothetical protein